MMKLSSLVAVGTLFATTAMAQDVNLTPDMFNKTIELNGGAVTFERNQNVAAVIDRSFAKTSRACPPFCIHPMSAGEGVETVGELEVIAYIEDYVAQGRGLLIDSRVPDWFKKGSIPGAVNVPFSTLAPENAYRDQILAALGGVQTGTTWDFEGATDLLMYCNGPWCDQSPRAIRYLLEVGYPANKIRYYRGGMQVWLSLGLNTVTDDTTG